MTGERVDPVVPLDPDRLDAIEAQPSLVVPDAPRGRVCNECRRPLNPQPMRVLTEADALALVAVTVPVPLTDIEAAARKATPGPWTTPDVSAVWYDGGWVLTDASVEDAAHIATAGPPTVLALTKALRIAVEGLREVDLGEKP